MTEPFCQVMTTYYLSKSLYYCSSLLPFKFSIFYLFYCKHLLQSNYILFQWSQYYFIDIPSLQHCYFCSHHRSSLLIASLNILEIQFSLSTLFAIGLLRYSRDSCNHVLSFVVFWDLLRITDRSLEISLDFSTSSFSIVVVVLLLVDVLCMSLLSLYKL